MQKKVLIIITILLGVTIKSFGQKIKEDKKDDFTNASIKRTSWETLSSALSSTVYFRISQINTSESFDVRLMLYRVFSVDKDAELSFKLTNGEVITLKNTQYTITCSGCGAIGLAGSSAEGLELTYPLSAEQVEKLKANKVVKVRIITNDGAVDSDVKDKNADKIIKSLELIK